MKIKNVYKAKIEKTKLELEEINRLYKKGSAFYPNDRANALENRIRNLTELAKKFRQKGTRNEEKIYNPLDIC